MSTHTLYPFSDNILRGGIHVGDSNQPAGAPTVRIANSTDANDRFKTITLVNVSPLHGETIASAVLRYKPTAVTGMVPELSLEANGQWRGEASTHWSGWENETKTFTGTTLPATPEVGGQFDIDVTAAFASAVANTHTDMVLVISPAAFDGEPDFDIEMHSRDAANSADRPVLLVTTGTGQRLVLFDGALTAASTASGYSAADLTAGATGGGPLNSLSSASGMGYPDEPVIQTTSPAYNRSSSIGFGSYFEFTLSGPATDITKVAMKAARGGSSLARGFRLRWSVDNYANDLLGQDIPTKRPALTDYSQALHAPGQTSVTFRVHQYAPSGGNSVEFDDIEVFGVASSGGGTPGNTAPTVSAGADANATTGQALSLTATASDADTDPLTYQWAKTSGPGNVVFSDDDALTTDATFDTAGSYVLTFTADDGTDATSDTVAITVADASTGGRTPHAGDLEIFAAGSTVENLDISGQLIIRTSNVTVRNVHAYQLEHRRGNTGLNVYDCEFVSPTVGTGMGMTLQPNTLVEDTQVLNQKDGIYCEVGGPVTLRRVTVDITNNIPDNHDDGITLPFTANYNGVNGFLIEDSTIWAEGKTAAFNQQGRPLTVTGSQWSGAVYSCPGSSYTSSFAQDPDNVRYLGDVVPWEVSWETFHDNVVYQVTQLGQAPSNQAPAITMPADFSVDTGENHTLTPSVYDPDGDTLTYQWVKTSGPGTVTFTAATSRDTDVSFSAAGTYVLTLTADDGAATTSDTVTATVASPQSNQPPSITFPSTPIPGAYVGNVIEIAPVYNDPDGDTLTHQWSVLAGPGNLTFVGGSQTSPNALVTADTAGTYTLLCQANDGAINYSEGFTFSVAAAPAANSGPTVTMPPLPLPGAYVGRVVPVYNDPDGDTLTHQWSVISADGNLTFVSGSQNAPDAYVVVDAPGNYHIDVLVDDGTDTERGGIQFAVTNPPAPAPSGGNSHPRIAIPIGIGI